MPHTLKKTESQTINELMCIISFFDDLNLEVIKIMHQRLKLSNSLFSELSLSEITLLISSSEREYENLKMEVL